MIAIAALILFSVWFVLLRPRRGGKNAPPTVVHSPVVPFPIVGVLAEFFKSPNTMIKRCYEDYGPVFTIPVRSRFVYSLVQMRFLVEVLRIMPRRFVTVA